MQILLPPNIVQRLQNALERAGTREIGGILMGEHISERVFRVKDLTIQYHGGSFAAFVRRVQDVIVPLTAFFRATNNNYSRFNYLGEWHSHPSFTLQPSSKDRETMHDLINDPQVGANFAILMIVKQHSSGQFEGNITVFLPDNQEYTGALVLEQENDPH